MQSRVYDLAVSVTASAQPDPQTPAANPDIVPLSFLSSLIKVLGSSTRASPTSVTAGGGIAFAAATGYSLYLWFVKGSSGNVDLSANPQIAAGSVVGQILILIGCSDTDTILLEDGTGLEMKNGSRRLVNGSIIALMWDGTNWCEMFWNNVGDLG